MPTHCLYAIPAWDFKKSHKLMKQCCSLWRIRTSVYKINSFQDCCLWPLGYLSIQSPGIHISTAGCTGLPSRDRTTWVLDSVVWLSCEQSKLFFSGIKKPDMDNQSGFTRKFPERPSNAFQNKKALNQRRLRSTFESWPGHVACVFMLK